MVTRRDEENFKEAITKDSLLSESIEWIKSNLSPEQVFDDEKLADWSTDNGFVKEGSE